jgi:hypothetical protein
MRVGSYLLLMAVTGLGSACMETNPPEACTAAVGDAADAPRPTEARLFRSEQSQQELQFRLQFRKVLFPSFDAQVSAFDKDGRFLGTGGNGTGCDGKLSDDCRAGDAAQTPVAITTVLSPRFMVQMNWCRAEANCPDVAKEHALFVCEKKK